VKRGVNKNKKFLPRSRNAPDNETATREKDARKISAFMFEDKKTFATFAVPGFWFQLVWVRF
jgi:hypothetical protein